MHDSFVLLNLRKHACSVVQSCPILCDSIDSSLPGICTWSFPGKNMRVLYEYESIHINTNSFQCPSPKLFSKLNYLIIQKSSEPSRWSLGQELPKLFL